jgi:glycosyltransferase involved in cell wall biosynthesis
MKILVSAFACNPYGGSEPGVGWTAVNRISRRHEVFVLTDIHNKEGWDKGFSVGIIPANIRVRFIRDKAPSISNAFVAHISSWLSYAEYNRLVLSAALEWHKQEQFDICHQVTIAAWRMPSPLWQLPIPFIWGPIGGAGFIPPEFRGMLSPSARMFERARDIQTALASRSRAFRSCIRETAVVFAANEETELFLKPFRGDKPLVRLPIASLPADKIARFRRPEQPAPTDGLLRLFAGGYMEGRKGVSLALRALAKVKDAGIDFKYTVAGGGPEISALRKLASALGIANRVEFHPGFHGAAFLNALHSTDVYFLPSFRESTPVTLLEAILAGCYPVVADTSAQGEIVRLTGGHAVPVTDMPSLIQGLADAVIWSARHREQLRQLTEASADRIAECFSSERYDATVDDAYTSALKLKTTAR